MHVLRSHCRLSIGTIMQQLFYFFIFLGDAVKFSLVNNGDISTETKDDQREGKGKKTFISRITRTERRWVHQKEPVYHGICSERQVPIT